ncbi:hypothetical protein [Bradyrhizobium sp. RDI18]
MKQKIRFGREGNIAFTTERQSLNRRTSSTRCASIVGPRLLAFPQQPR